MKLDDDKKRAITNDLCDLMIRNDVENFAIKQDAYACHAAQHGVDSKLARTLKISFDVVVKKEVP